LIDGELKRVCDKAVVVYFEALTHNFLEESRKAQRNLSVANLWARIRTRDLNTKLVTYADVSVWVEAGRAFILGDLRNV
jgi:hypothetical protein